MSAGQSMRIGRGCCLDMRSSWKQKVRGGSLFFLSAALLQGTSKTKSRRATLAACVFSALDSSKQASLGKSSTDRLLCYQCVHRQ